MAALSALIPDSDLGTFTKISRAFAQIMASEAEK